MTTTPARADSYVSLAVVATAAVVAVDAYLAAAVFLGWWWADPVAGLVVVYYGVREGREALR